MAKKKKKKIKNQAVDKPINFVHINMIKFNSDKIYVDRKKENKKGKIKHKGRCWYTP